MAARPGAGGATAALPWLVWGVAALFYCYGFFQRVAPSVMVEELMREFAATATILGNLTAFYFYAYASMQLPFGVMLDHIGPRRMLTGACLAVALGSLLFATADALPQAYIGRLLIGGGSGVAMIGTLKAASIWLPASRFGLVSGLTFMLGMVGAVAGQAPLAGVVDAVGWRPALQAAAAFGAALAVVLWLVVRDGRDATPAAAAAARPALLKGLARVAANPQSWYAALFVGSMAAAHLAFAGLWGVPYMMEAYALERPAAALSTSLMMIGFGIGAPLGGWVSDRIRRRRLPMLWGAMVALATFALLVYVPGIPLVAAQALLFLNGVFSAVMVVAFAAAREHNPPEAVGATMGFTNTIGIGSGALFQPVIGWVLDLNWDGTMAAGARVYSIEAYQLALLALVACNVLSVLAALLLRETHCRQAGLAAAA